MYYGALKGTPYRWLDIKSLTEELIPPQYNVEKVKYFTARVSGAEDPNAPARQQKYLSALAAQQEVEIHFGNFLAKSIWRPLINLPIAGAKISCGKDIVLPLGNHPIKGGSLKRPNHLPVGEHSKSHARKKRKIRPLSDAVVAEVHSMEEKGSDVNLAAHLLNDAWKNIFDAAVVFSNDTDLVTPIRMVTVERNKTVFVVCPGRSPMHPALETVATYKRHIRGRHLSRSQFPSPIPNTTITKPANW